MDIFYVFFQYRYIVTVTVVYFEHTFHGTVVRTSKQ